MLPWRRHDLQVIPFPTSPDALCAACEDALQRARPRIDLVALTGASDVTGEVWPLERLAVIAHRHGARLFVDAAQLAGRCTGAGPRSLRDRVALQETQGSTSPRRIA
jgi:selenocysteine lyase/cysteine desulfurase